jgi:hypothetical protein
MWFKKDKSRPGEIAKEAAAEAAALDPKPSFWGRAPGLRFFLVLLLLCGLVVGGAVGMNHLDKGVQKGKFGPVVKHVGVLPVATPPPWMPKELSRDICISIMPKNANYNDPDLTAKVQALAAANPWIRKVARIGRKLDERRVGLGLITIDVLYRQPVAAVRTEQGLAYVDFEGYRLPENQVPRFMKRESQGAGKPDKLSCYLHEAPGLERIHYMEIQGVTSPPPQVGRKWDAEDLAEGLKLADLMCRQPYAKQIAIVDVRNFSGRISRNECHLQLIAKDRQGKTTTIYFGQFPGLDAPAEIPSDRKLKYLEYYAKTHSGNLAGSNRLLDLRYDNLLVSND